MGWDKIPFRSEMGGPSSLMNYNINTKGFTKSGVRSSTSRRTHSPGQIKVLTLLGLAFFVHQGSRRGHIVPPPPNIFGLAGVGVPITFYYIQKDP